MQLPEIKQFKYKSFRIILKAIYSILMIGIITFVAIKLPYDKPWFPAFFLAPMVLMFGAFMYSALADGTLKLTITNSQILFQNVFSKKEFRFEDVKGFRLVLSRMRDEGLPGFHVEIESVNGMVMDVPKEIQHQDVLLEWLKANFVELQSNG